MFSLKRFLLTALGVPIGFALSLAGIILPWPMRNRYSSMLAIVTKRVLQSGTVIVFFKKAAFSKEDIMRVAE